MSTNPETTLTNKIKKALETSNSYCFKIMGNAFQEKGIPDLLCTINGKFVAIEVKVNNNKASKIQQKQIELLRQRGAKAVIIREDNWKEVIQKLKNMV